jgi:hypothetical protein
MDTPKNVIEIMNKDGLSLEFVKKQTEDVCIAAIKNNWKALRFVKNQTNNICFLALDITPFSLKNGTLNSKKNIIAPFQA